MKVLILCVALSVLLSVSEASPVKPKIRDESDSSDNSGSSELNKYEKNVSSASEEEKEGVHEYNGKDDEEENSLESSEEQMDKYINIKDISNGYKKIVVFNDRYYVAEVNDNETLSLKKLPGKSKRSVDFAASTKNQLTPNGERNQKYEKSFKQKLLRGALESDDTYNPHFVSQADTSEEHSSEESQEDKKYVGKVLAEQTAAGPVASNLKPQEESVKKEGSRHRRDIDVSPEDERSVQDHDVNEVFIFSNENPNDSAEEDFKINDLKSHDDVYEKLKNFKENKNSEEDYAQGCGESDDNQIDRTSENSDENNETAIDKL